MVNLSVRFKILVFVRYEVFTAVTLRLLLTLYKMLDISDELSNGSFLSYADVYV
jgi:hypothetical protein